MRKLDSQPLISCNKSFFSSDTKNESQEPLRRQPIKDDDPYEEKEFDPEPEYEQREEKQNFNEFKTHRKILFMIGKLLKWTCWASCLMYFYHLYLIIKHKDPENAFLANNYFLHAAGWSKFQYDTLTILLTRPPVERLLLDRPPLP